MNMREVMQLGIRGNDEHKYNFRSSNGASYLTVPYWARFGSGKEKLTVYLRSFIKLCSDSND